jgi:predicted outer membrane repeat protein
VSVQKSQFNLNRALYFPAGEGGGAIHLDNVPQWSVAGSGFIANNTASVGGAIFAGGGTGQITKSTFRGNGAGVSGGAINVFESDVKISGSLFSANQGTDGGALYAAKNANPATVLVTASRFTGNIATGNGGAVRLFSATMTVKNSTFDHNLSGADGGAIFANGIFDSEASFYRDNVADGAGGGIYGTSIFKLKGGAVTNNRAGGNGGGLAFTGAEPEITKVLVADNTSGGNGAGLYFDRAFPGVKAKGKMLQCKIVGNTVTSGASGGGIYVTVDVTFTLMKNVITDNISGDGGGIFSAGTAIDIDNKIFGNFAPMHPDSFGL